MSVRRTREGPAGAGGLPARARGPVFWLTLLLSSLIGCSGENDPTGPSTPVVASISLTPRNAQLDAGGQVRITATLRDAAHEVITGPSITWSSSAGAVAQVDATGLVSGFVPGETTIRAESQAASATAIVTVVAPPPTVAAVDVVPGDTVLVVGGSVRLAATPRGPDGTALTGKTVSWSVSSGAVATVDAGGRVLAVGVGEATVEATCEGVSGRVTLRVEPLVVDGEKVAFNTDRDGNFEIYLVNPDGTDPVNLTRHPGMDIHPAWSPDGSRIAFASDRSGNLEIWTMNADGSGLVRLTNSPGWDLFPSWSGTWIAFEREMETLEAGALEIFLMRQDGTGAVNLTKNVDFARGPSLSPDGSRVVFQSDRDYDIDFTEIWPEIWVMDADGSNPVNLSNTDTASDMFPEWSPDGTRIAFSSDRSDDAVPGPGDVFEVHLMNADGSGVVKLTETGGAYSPAWSRDGTQIVFVTGNDLAVIGTDGTGLRKLTADPAVDAWPAWRP